MKALWFQSLIIFSRFRRFPQIIQFQIPHTLFTTTKEVNKSIFNFKISFFHFFSNPVYPSFINDTMLLLYQDTSLRLIDISNRSNISQIAQWNFNTYQGYPTMFGVYALNSSVAFVCIGNNFFVPADLLLVNISNFNRTAILKSQTLNNTNQNPSRFGVGMTFTSTNAYWASGKYVVSLNFETWKVSISAFPKPFDLGLSGDFNFGRLSLSRNLTNMILSVSVGFETIFLDVTSMSNVRLVDSYGATPFGKISSLTRSHIWDLIFETI